jgi:DNA-binding XRE family transcriptional regulator
MAKDVSEPGERMFPAARAESEREFRRNVQGMRLQRLREARHLTQTNLATVMGISQSEVSKIERRADVYVSTLGSYIQALGGKLEVSAIFPDGGMVKINQFEGLGEGDAGAVTTPKPLAR